MQFKLRIALALAAAGFLPPVAALAADYDPPIYVDQAPEYQPVEVGSGWYLRGDIGYAFNKPFDFSQSPPSFSSKQVPFSGSVGVGYHFNDFVRGELNFGILPTAKYSNDFQSTCDGTQTVTITNNNNTQVFSGRSTRNCQGSDNANNKAYDATVNAYVDLGTFSGITPYVGGGLGLVYSSYRAAKGDRKCQGQTTSYGNSTTVFECDDPSTYEGVVTSSNDFSLSYALAAGIAYQVSKNVSVDIGYQYYSAPGVKYISYDANNGPVVDKGLDYHQVKVGLRYDLW